MNLVQLCILQLYVQQIHQLQMQLTELCLLQARSLLGLYLSRAALAPAPEQALLRLWSAVPLCVQVRAMQVLGKLQDAQLPPRHQPGMRTQEL